MAAPSLVRARWRGEVVVGGKPIGYVCNLPIKKRNQIVSKKKGKGILCHHLTRL